MSIYRDELSSIVEAERADNQATREDWEAAIERVFGKA